MRVTLALSLLVSAAAFSADGLRRSADGPCKSWCAPHHKSWEEKCEFKSCSGCESCGPASCDAPEHWNFGEQIPVGHFTHPTQPCNMGECSENGEFFEIAMDCMEHMMPDSCAGTWEQVEGQCCSTCVETPRQCKAWCRSNPQPLEKRCTFDACNGCDSCESMCSPPAHFNLDTLIPAGDFTNPEQPCQAGMCDDNQEFFEIAMDCMEHMMPDSCAGTWEQVEGQCCSTCVEPEPVMCCRAMTASCLACSAGVSVEDYCALASSRGVDGCPEPEPEPVMCCRAMTASCLACDAGVSVEEYCARAESVGMSGCPEEPEEPEEPEYPMSYCRTRERWSDEKKAYCCDVYSINC